MQGELNIGKDTVGGHGTKEALLFGKESEGGILDCFGGFGNYTRSSVMFMTCLLHC